MPAKINLFVRFGQVVFISDTKHTDFNDLPEAVINRPKLQSNVFSLQFIRKNY